MPDRDWWSTLWPDPEGVLREIGIKPHMTVLDLCCGDGYFTAPLAKLVEGKVHALDLDPTMLEKAKTELSRQGATVRQWICADALEVTQHMAYPVDFVLMANTFHGVPDQRRLAAEVREVLAPKGAFAIINWHPVPREHTTVLGRPRGPATDMRMSLETVSAIIEPAGFRAVSIADFRPYHYGIVFERGTGGSILSDRALR